MRGTERIVKLTRLRTHEVLDRAKAEKGVKCSIVPAAAGPRAQLLLVLSFAATCACFLVAAGAGAASALWLPPTVRLDVVSTFPQAALAPLPLSADAAGAGIGGPPAYAAQCGQDFSSGMPLRTDYSPDWRTTCTAAELEAALAGAARASPPVPWAQRMEKDGADDGALRLAGACVLHWFSPREACAALQRLGGIVLVGDSLARHLELALRQVLSGNWAAGGFLGGDHPADGMDRWSACYCEDGYGKRWQCHSLPSDPAPARFRATCPDWQLRNATVPPLHFLPYWLDAWNDGVVRGLLGALAPTGSAPPVLLVEIGPAWDYKFIAGDEQLRAHLLAAARAAAEMCARLVCFLVPAPDDARKPEHVMPRQSDAATRSVNEYVRGVCKANGGIVLDGYALTQGAWTRDGTHYEGKINTLFAQALLNLASSL